MEKISLLEHQKCSLQLLVDFDRVCRKHKLCYSLIYGTLLGAVRHQGFIPWDDDVDVVMPRKDYERLLQLTKEFKHPYQLCEHSITQGYIHPIAKLIHTETILKEKVNLDSVMPLGLYIDIFPADKVPMDKREFAAYHHRCFKNAKKLAFSVLRFRDTGNGVKNIGKKVILGFYHMRGALVYLKKFDALIEKSKSFQSNINKIIAFPEHCNNEIYDEDFLNCVEIMFEGKPFYVISHYEQWLKATYGDYMKLPPLEQRISNHHSEAYWK